MLPSSAGSEDKSSQLRRFGPIAIVVVIALVIGIVVLVSGGSDKKTAATSSNPAASAISFSAAKAQGLNDVTFPKSCDTATGLVAMPFHFASECYLDAKPSGASTAKGVTADSITVVVYVGQENDPVLDFITAAIASDDTNDQIEATYRGYTDMFQSLYQTYGRKVVLKFLVGSGIATDSIAARADAVKATEELGAFAVWGGPALAPSWTEEVKAHGVICLGCAAIDDRAPVVFPITASAEQTRIQLVEYIAKKLKGQPAKFAGDAALQSQTRKLGHVYIDNGGDEQAGAADLKKRLGVEGVDLAAQVSYQLDPARLQEQAVTIISQLRSAGVTSVVFQGDPVAPGTFTAEATKQDYHPEWIIGGSPLVDTTAFGRTYDQSQWAHAFGISSLAARVAPDSDPSTNLYKWFTGTDAPAFDTSGVIFPQPALFFAALQAAGPDLTTDSFRQGLFSFTTPGQGLTSPTISYGDRGLYPGTDYNGIDDFTEIWWDATASGPDEIRKQGTGMYRYADGGKRYFPGTWTSDEKAFVATGSVTIYEKIPAAEQPKTYPTPETTSPN
jgi:hypothetical protein